MKKLNGLSAAGIAVALGAIVLSVPAAAQAQEFAPFWKDFAAAAKAGDKAKVRGVMKFPFLYLSDLREEKDFDAIWKGLFTAKVRTCLGKGKPKLDDNAKPPNYVIFCGDTGFYFEKTDAGWRFTETGVND
jgi:hypothetical protein